MMPKRSVDHSVGTDRSIMSDEEWLSIFHNDAASKKENSKRYAARMASTVDWDNLPEDAANEVRKIFRERADHSIMKQSAVSPGEYFMDRPMDISLD